MALQKKKIAMTPSNIVLIILIVTQFFKNISMLVKNE